MRFGSAFALLLSVSFAVALPSPAPKKKNESSSVHATPAAASPSSSLEKKIEPSITKEVNAGDEEGVDLLRAKKSPTTTTFCVEIKPGTDETSVVVCDPNKKNQQYVLPGTSPPTLVPKPPAENPFNIPQTIPDYIPDFPSIIPGQQQPQTFTGDPLIFIPQQPQILQPPFYPQFLNPQPQIIFVRDPNCASNKPNIGSNPLLTNLIPSQLTSAQLGYINPKSASPMFLGSDQNQDLWKSGMNNIGEAQPRSFGGISAGDSFTNPIDLIIPRKGNPNPPNQEQIPQKYQPQYQPQPQPQYQPQPQPQYQPQPQPQYQPQPEYQPQPQPQYQPPPQSQPQPQPQRPGFSPGTMGSENQYDRPILIQCNPMVIPLTDEAYSAATGSNRPGMNEPGMTGPGLNKPGFSLPGLNLPGLNGLGSSVGLGKPLYRSAMGYGQPMVSAGQAIYMPRNQGAMLYQRQAQLASGGMSQQPGMMNAGMMGEMMPSSNQFNGAPRGAGDIISKSEDQAALAKGGGGSGGSSSAVQPTAEHSFNAPLENQGQTKGQNLASGLQSGGGGGGIATAPAAFAQGGGEKDQVYQKQLNQEFSQPEPQKQHQQQSMRNGIGNQQTGEVRLHQPQLSTAGEKMRHMKSSMSQDNMVQPFMMPMGDKMS